MQLLYKESIDLAFSINKELENINLNNLEVGICPDYLTIPEISKKIKNDKLKLGTQDIFWENKGAFTGEVSIENLKLLGVEYVIVGHSERRQHLAESDAIINKKMKNIVKNGLTPVLCVGENFEERRNDQKDFVVMRQVKEALDDLEFFNLKKIIIAYEPVWVIGSGQAIEPDEAEHTNLVIKEAVLETFTSNGSSITRKELEERCLLIYGGSVDKNNVYDFVSKSNVNGVLVGGASLRLDSFLDLINIVNKI